MAVMQMHTTKRWIATAIATAAAVAYIGAGTTPAHAAPVEPPGCAAPGSRTPNATEEDRGLGLGGRPPAEGRTVWVAPPFESS
ncbi:hypothetical protein B7755_003255 [Streptomyces sp. NBS 14/10]|uniref:hypothetical protein n=1 Tax=Streptomyces sp. NBS 14/10 TaxID=1945643 RepID=UPI0015C5FA41|nr:hypothetical protein [Streptomyces sp. NBS 14/10]KAK1177258.1 hypothetical protein B7755_003255 [Streptomyces sp. NBS 14/10]NUP44677.1 hypothetical protein [Streptomyces sp.]NUS84148.1 hypothetical protein [Streptomyces sp.]